MVASFSVRWKPWSRLEALSALPNWLHQARDTAWRIFRRRSPRRFPLPALEDVEPVALLPFGRLADTVDPLLSRRAWAFQNVDDLGRSELRQLGFEVHSLRLPKERKACNALFSACLKRAMHTY